MCPFSVKTLTDKAKYHRFHAPSYLSQYYPRPLQKGISMTLQQYSWAFGAATNTGDC